VRLLAPLDHLADDSHAGGSQQLTQLGEVVPSGSAATQKARWTRAVFAPSDTDSRS